MDTAAALFYSAPPADVEHRPPSAGGRAKKTDGTTDHKWRIDPLSLLPEMGSFTPGSVNLNPIVYENSPQLVQDLAQKYCDTEIKPQIEVCSSPGI